jgi:tetratricopeptide (TPR) repeat protein
LQIAEKLHNPTMQARLDLLMSRAALDLGRLDESWIYLHDAWMIGQENQLPEIQSAYHSVLGLIYKELHDYPNAIESFQASLDGKHLQSQALGDQCFLAEALYLNGQESASMDILRQLAQIAKESETGFISLPAELGLARLELSSGNIKEARHTLDTVAFDAIQHSLVTVAISAELLLSRIAVQENNLSKALAGALKAIERSREIANPWLELEGLLLLKDLSGRGCQLELDPSERIRELLTAIRAKVTNPDILPVFEKLVQNSFEKMG